MKRSYKMKLDLSTVRLQNQVFLNTSTCDKVVTMAASIVADGITDDTFTELSTDKEIVTNDSLGLNDLGYE